MPQNLNENIQQRMRKNMPIAIQEKDRTNQLSEEEYRNEAELQAFLERSPYLIVSGSEPQVATVLREVQLPAAGILDLLLVDEEGVPVAVEVKLARNSQSRREVVAQAFDYVSDLNQLTIDELDDLVDGALMGALEELAGQIPLKNIRKQCGTNLRAGLIKLVIAVDRAGEDLIRMVRYINDHSDLDVRLVALSKFDGGRIIVPRILVSGGNNVRRRRTDSSSRVPKDPVFEQATDIYNQGATEALRTRGHGKKYQQIRPDHWPKLLHYEFGNYSYEIGVELHLESDDLREMADELPQFAGTELSKGVILEWDPRWSRQRGRLIARISKEEAPGKMAEAMQTLVSITQETMEKNLAKIAINTENDF
jgi:hypothetical protein